MAEGNKKGVGVDKDSVNLVNQLAEKLGAVDRSFDQIRSNAYAFGKALGMSKTEADKLQGNFFAMNNTMSSMEMKMLKQAKTVQQLDFYQNRLNNMSKNNLDIAEEMVKAEADLLKYRVASETNLTGVHASQAAELNLMMSKGVLSKQDYEREIKRLQNQYKQTKDLEKQLQLEEKMADAILEIKEEAEEYKKTYEKIFQTARAIGNDPKVLGAFMFSKGMEALEKFTAGFESFKEMGLTGGQAVNAQFKTMDVTSMDWWLGLSDTKGVMQGIVSEYGNVNALSKETVSELGKMAHHFGISGEEAAKLNASLSELPGETSETAAHAMEATGHMAEMAGIAPGKIMKDMAANSGTMALYSKGGAEAFGKSAIALHKMGVEIGTAAKMADGLLNFEDSINKQMEASVLLGREINLDKARELALAGDLEGSTAEVLKNIGGSAEFEKMNVMQKKALAEATGMTVEELQKSIDAQEESNKYFGEGASAADNALGTMLQYGSSAAGFFKENGMLLMASLNFILQGNAAKLVGYAKDTAHWAKEKAHMLWVKAQSALGMGGGAAKAGAGALGKGADMATKATEGAAGAAEKANNIKPGKGGVAQTFKDVAAGLKEFASGKVIMGALALIPVSVGLVAMLAGLPTVFLLSIPGIGKGFQMNMAGIGKGLSSLGNAAANPMTWLGILLLAAFGAALIPLTFALSLLAPVIEAFGKVITAVFEGMAVLIGAIADAFVVMFQAFADNWQVLIPVGLGLGVLGAGMLALGAASWFAFPGLMLAAAGLALMIPGLTIVNEIAQANAFGALGESLALISAAGPGLTLVGLGLMGIAGGLSLMAVAGLSALPIIGALTMLAAVAPALSGLMGGGGGGKEEDGMEKIAQKLDQLIAIASKGGEVKMDGKKVGEVVRLGLNMSNVR